MISTYGMDDPFASRVIPQHMVICRSGQGGETGAAGTRTPRARTGDLGPGTIVDHEFGESLGHVMVMSFGNFCGRLPGLVIH